MALIDRYIFRLMSGAFLVTLGALTGVIWVTQALKDFNLLTNEGQSLFMFLRLTLLLLPSMMGLIAPIALLIAAIQTLQRLNADSELIVIGASGISPLRLVRPTLLLGALVAIGVSLITLWAAPSSFRNWRDLITTARAEFVSKIVREGRFNTLNNGVVFHYRERVGEALLGLFIQDRRDPDLTIVYVAERGQIIDGPTGTFLVLLDGSVQRETQRDKDASIISFKRYALDLAMIAPNGGEIVYRPRERSSQDLVSTIMSGRMTKDERGLILSEMTERVSTPLYSFAFIFIALAAFARPGSTRQKKLYAISTAILAALIVRLAGFALVVYIQQKPDFYWVALLCPVLTSLIAFLTLSVTPLTFTRTKARAVTP